MVVVVMAEVACVDGVRFVLTGVPRLFCPWRPFRSFSFCQGLTPMWFARSRCVRVALFALGLAPSSTLSFCRRLGPKVASRSHCRRFAFALGLSLPFWACPRLDPKVVPRSRFARPALTLGLAL